MPQNGDYNADGVVDGVDYLVWATNYGAHFTAGQASSGTRATGAENEYTHAAAAGGSLPYRLADDGELTSAVDAVFEGLLLKKRLRRHR